MTRGEGWLAHALLESSGLVSMTFPLSCVFLFPLGGSRLELRIFVAARTSKQTRGLQQRLDFWLCLCLDWLALPLLQSGESKTCGLVLWGSPSNAGTESTWDFILHNYHYSQRIVWALLKGHFLLPFSVSLTQVTAFLPCSAFPRTKEKTWDWEDRCTDNVLLSR